MSGENLNTCHETADGCSSEQEKWARPVSRLTEPEVNQAVKGGPIWFISTPRRAQKSSDMPYIAFDLDALNVARDMGNMCGLDEAHVTHGLLRMWSWCFRASLDIVSPGMVKGFFGAEACEALETFGFIESAEGGFRVKGADRYLRIKEGQRKGGLAGKGNLIPGGKNSQKKTKTQKQVDPRSSRGGPDGSAEVKPEVGPGLTIGSLSAFTPNTEHHIASTYVEACEPEKNRREISDALVEVFLEVRESKYAFQNSKDGQALSKLLPLGSKEEILKRWRRGLLESGWLQVSTIAQLAAKWNDLTAGAPKAGKPEFDPNQGITRRIESKLTQCAICSETAVSGEIWGRRLCATHQVDWWKKPDSVSVDAWFEEKHEAARVKRGVA